jgi:microcystin-dependent protein
MPATTNPELLITPLAKNAEKNVIPETTGATTGLFSQDLGFQEINSTPLTAGGKAPDRKDFNGAFFLLGGVAFYAQKGWTFHYDASQDYYLGCVVIDSADGNRYECIADMAAGTVAPHDDTDGDYWRRYTLGDGEAVGVIKQFAGNGDIPSGYLLCDGSAVSRTMFPDLFSAIGTTYGAGDGSTTFNVPDYNTAQRFAQGGTVAGVEKSAGLPNITGNSDTRIATASKSGGALGSGALNINADELGRYDGTSGTSHSYGAMSFDASRSNPIYGASDTVQPPALTTRYIIKAFDGQTADSALIDITQYAQELAGKANITGSNMVYHKDVITTSGTYTAPVTGLYKITVKGGGGGGAGGGYDTSTSYGGSGGGEGGTTIAYEFISSGESVDVIVGAGGTGGAGRTTMVGIEGANGGTTSVTVNGNTHNGVGGEGGGRAGNISGGAGTIPGAPGGGPIRGTVDFSVAGGVGGGNGGGKPIPNSYGTDGVNGGGGAGGGARKASSLVGKGGNGGNGYVWFEYYTPGA